MPLTPIEVAALIPETAAVMEQVADALQGIGDDLDHDAIDVWRALREAVLRSSPGGRRVTRDEWREIRSHTVALHDAIARIDWASTQDARLAVGALAIHLLRDWDD